MSRVLVGVRLCSPLRLPSPSCNFLITSHRCSAALPTENCIARCSRSAALAATVVLGASLLGTQPAMSYEVEVLDVSAAPLSSPATHIATRATHAAQRRVQRQETASAKTRHLRTKP